MSITRSHDQQGAPLLVVDIRDLIDHAERVEGSPVMDERAYSQTRSWKKTDISNGIGVAVTASRIVLNGDVRELGGWAISETTGAAVAALRLHDGNNVATEVYARINLLANASSIIMPDVKRVQSSTGRVFLEVISGSIEGVIYWR